MIPESLFALALTVVGLGFTVVTSYLFAVGARSNNQRVILGTSLVGVVLGTVGGGIAYFGFYTSYVASPLPQSNLVGGLSNILWMVVWFAIIIVLTQDAESLWNHRFEALE